MFYYQLFFQIGLKIVQNNPGTYQFYPEKYQKIQNISKKIGFDSIYHRGGGC